MSASAAGSAVLTFRRRSLDFWIGADIFALLKGRTMNANRGMTLIELMVVVAIVAILGAIAYPSYQSYIIRANRSAAQQLMLKIASREEQYRLDAKTYTVTLGGTSGMNIVEDGWDCTTTVTQCSNARYRITVALDAGPPPGYTITATSTGPQVSDGNLTLNALGTKTPADKWKK
jgi:type IV pilus assembly protein PilE